MSNQLFFVSSHVPMFYHFHEHDGFIFSQVGSFKWIIFFHRVALLSARIFYHNNEIKIATTQNIGEDLHKVLRFLSCSSVGEIEFGMRTMQFTGGNVGQTRKALTYFPFSLQLMLGMGGKKKLCT